MKNILEGVHGRLDLAEKRIKGLKDRWTKTMQSKKNREKKNKGKSKSSEKYRMILSALI